MISRALTVAATVLCALGVACCGGGGGDDGASRDPKPTPTSTPTPAPERSEASPGSGVDDADLRVVREWADTLRHGDVEGAAKLFALPARVANGWSPIRLTNRTQVRLFNRALPCGAKVIGAESAPHGFLIATFRLTERPGKGACGGGTGGTARTAFRVRDGLITDWLRVPDEQQREQDAEPI
jgi:hypothetical protein